MAEKKFAFESGEVSVAFTLDSGLGDAIIARKVFDAIIELAPNCRVDIFYVGENRRNFAHAFYGGSKNLNLIVPRNEHYKNLVQRYDLAFYVAGSWAVILEHANGQRLQTLAPLLLQAVMKIAEYNKANIQNIGAPGAVSLRNFAMSRVLNKNCYEILSCDGALPIRDDKVNIPLLPEYKPEFDALKLGNYITIYSDIERGAARPKIKTWSMRYLVEFVALVKQYLPQIEIVQCGGDDVKVENADRHFMGVDLELTKHILSNSLLHVGCEGGLVHLATALGTKCLVLFGFSSVYYYGYKRNINLVSDVCYPCANIVGDGNLNFCLRGNKEPPCMLSHTPRQVFEVTRNYLNRLDLKNNA